VTVSPHQQRPHLQIKLIDKAATDIDFKKKFRSSPVCMPIALVRDIGEVVTIDKSFEELGGTSDIVERKE
jgi:hypothetical protein